MLKSGKTLKFDVAVIAIVQVAVLLYGVYTLLVARPLCVASLGRRFDVVQAIEVEQEEFDTAGESLPVFGPQCTGIKLATYREVKEQILLGAISGAYYGHFPQYYQSFKNMRDEILKNAQKISELKKLNPGEEAAIDRWIEKHGIKPDEVVFQGLKARAKDMAVILNAKAAKVIGIAPFKPWP